MFINAARHVWSTHFELAIAALIAFAIATALFSVGVAIGELGQENTDFLKALSLLLLANFAAGVAILFIGGAVYLAVREKFFNG